MMKKLALLFLLLSLPAFAQKGGFFRHHNLPDKSFLLNNGWKYSLGDYPDYAKSDFDDSKWQDIDPTKDIFDLPQLTKDGSVFWLQLRIPTDSL